MKLAAPDPRATATAPAPAIDVDVDIASAFSARLFGWLGRISAPIDRGLWLTPCSCVHTFGMRFAIDLVFIDRNETILRVDAGVCPWRVRSCAGASGVIELRAGRAAELGLSRGLRVEPRSP